MIVTVGGDHKVGGATIYFASSYFGHVSLADEIYSQLFLLYEIFMKTS